MIKLPEQALAVILRVGLFLFLALVGQYLLGAVLWALFEPRILFVSTVTVFSAAAIANALAMRIYERRTLMDLGLHWNAASARNALAGAVGGIGAGMLVSAAPLLTGGAELVPAAGQDAGIGGILFLLVLIVFGGIGEELLFRGYGFQVLMGSLGAFATILPVSVLFAVTHGGNPNVTLLGLVNTALWGVVLGAAFWRSGDLWLPIGLHVGWNWTLPLLGASLSGFKMNVTGYELRWRVAPLWSGGDYGPEGGLLTTAVLALLFVWMLWKAPIRRQTPYLLRDRWEE